MQQSQSRSDGMNYAPQGKAAPVVKKGEFRFSAVGLDHGHIFGQCNGLLEAGAELVAVYDPDPAKVEAFIKRYPEAKAGASESAVLSDPTIQMVTSAAVPADRAALGMRVMDAGKDYFVDKPPFTTQQQIKAARAKCHQTHRKYAVYYSERLHNESSVYAGQLIRDGVIGRVVQTAGLGPHRANLKTRPPWFFQRERYGGILVDIGSHQVEQFLFFTGNTNARVVSSRVANYKYKEHPGLDDFGEASLVGDNGATGYFRLDWLTPDGLGSWGDGRLFILGTDGYIELRKYIDVAREATENHVYLVTHKGEQHVPVAGKVGFPFFGELILDCLHRTEKAMTQEHAFRAAELSIECQATATRVEG